MGGFQDFLHFILGLPSGKKKKNLPPQEVSQGVRHRPFLPDYKDFVVKVSCAKVSLIPSITKIFLTQPTKVTIYPAKINLKGCSINPLITVDEERQELELLALAKGWLGGI